ncbi:MAG: TonB-dependent receptor [Lewinellaceae bacterium]|nr:TonB-dependent receptor [Lewinellaceae bacterium]
MKQLNKFLIFSLLCMLFGSVTGFAQITLRGKVVDGESGEELIGAAVAIQGGGGAITDYNGEFHLQVDALPVTVKFAYTGYTPQDIEITSEERIVVRLAPGSIVIAETVVKGQRIDDKQKAAPLTVENMDAIAIRETAAVSFYNGLGNLKGVDLTTASLGFTIINTRGFNSTSPVRSLQIIDGVDNQAPGLNFSLGNFLGSSDLDVLKVDLIQGASSAFYGPNAFNGVISMETKNPFLNKGLAVSLKTGERSLYEGAARWAGALRNKAGKEWMAAKINFFYLSANDWEADNYDPVTGTQSGGYYFTTSENPGRYDAVNIYGDEYLPRLDASSNSWWNNTRAGIGIYHRTGYREVDLVDYDTRNLKTNVALHFRTQPDKDFESPELIISSSYGTGTTVYQGDNRFSLRGIKFFQNRIEFRKTDKFFIRAYATNEDAGDSFDPYFTALKLQEASKDNSRWAEDYERWWTSQQLGYVYFGKMQPLNYPDINDTLGLIQWLDVYRDSMVEWHRQAETYANKGNPLGFNPTLDYFAPGTARFDSLFDAITSRKSNAEEGGTLFYDKSALYHMHGEYTFTPTFLDRWVVGANSRFYRPNSDGTIFKDTSGVSITNWEVGAYTGVERTFGKFKLNAALRLDKNQNFDLLATPAASVVWNPKANTFLRASFSSAIRNPTLTDQYLNLNVGRARLVGNIDGFDSLITIESFNEYRRLPGASVAVLQYFNVDPIQPEKVKTMEAGIRTTLFDRLYVDLGYYYSIYTDFIGYNLGIDVPIGFFGPEYSRLRVYRVAANSQNTVTTQGMSIGMNFYFANYFMIQGNYSWNRLNTKLDDPIIPAFNTPENKFNVGFSARDLTLVGKNTWGFNITYKWIQGFIFEGSPQFTGDIPTYDLLDAQVNCTIARWNTTIKVGAANLLNNKQFQTYGGPRIGRMAYVSLLYDFRKK